MVRSQIFKMRVENSKLSTVKALQSIGFETIASGDSYNDLGMIQAGKAGFLFRTTDKIKEDHPEIPAYETYAELLGAIKSVIVREVFPHPAFRHSSFYSITLCSHSL